MSDQDWNEETAVPPKKKGIPSWLLFCGGGCLIAVILSVIGAYFAVGMVKDAINPEKQWPRFEEVAQLDARPPELLMILGTSVPMDIWMLKDERGYIVAYYSFDESEAEAGEEIFSDEFKGGGVPGLNKINSPEQSELLVQGRAISVLRFQNSGGINIGGSSGGSGASAGCFLDVTGESELGFKMLFVMRDPGQKSDIVMEPISDEVLQELLLPFQIGPEHLPYVAPRAHPQAGMTGLDVETLEK